MSSEFKNRKYIKGLCRDIRVNKIGYIKSEIVANKVREHDPEIIISYDKEERLYTATYNMTLE
jgi:hypothetical protein